MSGINEEDRSAVVGLLSSKKVLLRRTLGAKEGIFDGVAVNNAVGLVAVGNPLGFRVVEYIEGDLERVEGMELVGKTGDPEIVGVGLVVRDSEGLILEDTLEMMVGLLVVGRILGMEDGLTL